MKKFESLNLAMLTDHIELSLRLPHSGVDTLDWRKVHREKSRCRVRGAVRVDRCADALGSVHPANATQRSLQNM